MAAGSNLDYSRLIYLNQRVKDNLATQEERDEYILDLYNNGNITKKQYDAYRNGNSDLTEDVIKAAVTIGGILLVAYLISKLFDNGK